jgi:hypothetical protein
MREDVDNGLLVDVRTINLKDPLPEEHESALSLALKRFLSPDTSRAHSSFNSSI